MSLLSVKKLVFPNFERFWVNRASFREKISDLASVKKLLYKNDD